MATRTAPETGRIRTSVDTPLVNSARVTQMSALFDVPWSERAKIEWDVPLPVDEKSWNVGLIVGPSGSGKTTVARAAFGLTDPPAWSEDRSLLDDFPKGMSVRDITGLLCAVGLSAAPSWMRPHHVLSNGEQFRASMARLVAETRKDDLVVVDEFTSVVDRQVAKVASHALQKTIRREKRRFVAVTCHYDVVDWLQPDWVLDVSTREFTWRSQRPHPPLELVVAEVGRAAWTLFAPHHYLSAHLHPAAHCYGGWIDGQLVAFTSYLHFPHSRVRDIKMGHRLVVLPDFQGLGIGGRLDDWLGQYLHERGYRYRNVVAHPAMVNFYARSPRWRLTNGPKKQVQTGKTHGPRRGVPRESTRHGLSRRSLNPRQLNSWSFEYQPPAREKHDAVD
jgi:ABC-type lipoprotein export system ATPase subunit